MKNEEKANMPISIETKIANTTIDKDDGSEPDERMDSSAEVDAVAHEDAIALEKQVGDTESDSNASTVTLIDGRQQNNQPIKKRTMASLGDGLYRTIDIFDVASYKFRRTINGEIINVPIGRTSEDEARKFTKKLNERCSKIISKKKGNIAASKISKAKNQSIDSPCFKSRQDAIKFIDALARKVNIIGSTGMRPKTEIDALEPYFAVWLQLLTPLNIQELLEGRWRDVYVDSTYSWWSLQSKVNQVSYSVPLGKTAKLTLQRLRMVSTPIFCNTENGNSLQGSTLVFPHLSTLSKTELKNELDLAINMIWPDYRVNSQDFILFFQKIANEFSCYKIEFIQAYSKKQNARGRWQNCQKEAMALADWWDDQIMTRKL